ncbi:sulfotransferase domain-containing protein [Methylotetracoccus oryzae]|uniref:sulfotransferase domain-containing protein n=1 Tax=Methylotetracoccus oryzae TaxID=1919059 RepID=UPI001119FBE2|nr:sulfotransferase domain-containing protein [Methylotetracoccus oryzae]
MKPTFIGIGAQKCASSWIYRILEDHPEVCLSERKELDFFSYHYDNGYQWYERHFACGSVAKAVGEISPSYFHDYDAPARAKEYDPRLKVIVSLRDPIERALSHHKHLVRLGFYTGPDFSFEAGLAQNPSYVEQGLYAKHLSRWLSEFPPEQLLILYMDDIRADADAVVRQVYRFLGIAEDHRPAALHVKANPSYVVRNRMLDIFVKRCRAGAKALGLRSLWQALGRTPLRGLYEASNRIDSDAVIPAMLPETRAQLHSVFDEDTRQLAVLTSRAVSWTKE